MCAQFDVVQTICPVILLKTERDASQNKQERLDSVGTIEPRENVYDARLMTQTLNNQELLARLVRFASVSDQSNLPIAQFICSYLDRAGAEIDEYFDADGSQMNIVARIGPKVDRNGLALSGHLDVVPADEPQWSSDPFQLREANGKLFGRGSCDMKASVALFMNLFREVDPDQMKAPLVLMFTYGEELGSLGAQELTKELRDDVGALPRACIVGEPTSLQAVRMHKGHLKMRITAKGKAAHSGSPHLGVNAIEVALPLMNVLSQLRVTLEKDRPANSEYFKAVPFVALNMAKITGGGATNVIPESCTIDIGLRPLPGMKPQELTELVEECARVEVPKGSEIRAEVINDNPPMLTEANAQVNRVLCDIIEQKETLGVSYASDGGAFNRDLEMECVLFGPGTIEVAHRPDEFVPMDEFERAKETLRKVVWRMCYETER